MFLKEGSEFPPKNWEFWMNKYNEYRVWYSGETEELARFYSSKLLNPYSENSVFWARLEGEERENIVHMPLAGDIAEMSANLLFSESPYLNYERNKSGENLKVIIEENGLDNFLLESSEMAAALSGVFLKIDIDKRVAKKPIFRAITPLQAFPTFLCGRLWEVLFYREVKIEKNGHTVYRLFENRKRTENGFTIEFKLYKGSDNKVGRVVDIESIEETAMLNLQDQEIKGVDGIGVVYVPNKRPNKLAPGSPLGINDYNSSISLLDSLDLAWTSLVRDIELGMGQIFVDEELIQRESQTVFGTEKSLLNKFSKFHKCFMQLNFSNYKMGEEKIEPIKISQFEMRVKEHTDACYSIAESTISQCGYSPQTFGLKVEGRAESGTSLRIKERKSLLTRDKKSRYWQQAIKALLLQAQQVDNYFNTTSIVPQTISVELEDSIVVDSKEQSETIRNLDTARAVSTYIKVKMQHTDWTEEEIGEEVKRIQDEEGEGGLGI